MAAYLSTTAQDISPQAQLARQRAEASAKGYREGGSERAREAVKEAEESPVIIPLTRTRPSSIPTKVQTQAVPDYTSAEKSFFERIRRGEEYKRQIGETIREREEAIGVGLGLTGEGFFVRTLRKGLNLPTSLAGGLVATGITLGETVEGIIVSPKATFKEFKRAGKETPKEIIRIAKEEPEELIFAGGLGLLGAGRSPFKISAARTITKEVPLPKIKEVQIVSKAKEAFKVPETKTAGYAIEGAAKIAREGVKKTDTLGFKGASITKVSEQFPSLLLSDTRLTFARGKLPTKVSPKPRETLGITKALDERTSATLSGNAQEFSGAGSRVVIEDVGKSFSVSKGRGVSTGSEKISVPYDIKSILKVEKMPENLAGDFGESTTMISQGQSLVKKSKFDSRRKLIKEDITQAVAKEIETLPKTRTETQIKPQESGKIALQTSKDFTLSRSFAEGKRQYAPSQAKTFQPEKTFAEKPGFKPSTMQKSFTFESGRFKVRNISEQGTKVSPREDIITMPKEDVVSGLKTQLGTRATEEQATRTGLRSGLMQKQKTMQRQSQLIRSDFISPQIPFGGFGGFDLPMPSMSFKEGRQSSIFGKQPKSYIPSFSSLFLGRREGKTARRLSKMKILTGLEFRPAF